MNKIRLIWKKVKIKNKIIITYITILILTFVMTFSIISTVNAEYTKKEVGEAGLQTINALSGNLSFIFDNVTQFSNLIYFNDNIQESLKKIDSNSINLEHQRNITKSLVNMILSGDYISGVFIFDRFNNCYDSYKRTPKAVNNTSMLYTSWYRKMKVENGNGFFTKGSEGVIEYYGDNNYLCYIRQIGDKDTYESLATLVITIDVKTIQKYFDEVSSQYNSQFFIVDSDNKYIVEPTDNKEELDKLVKTANRLDKEYKAVKLNGEKQILVSQGIECDDGWKLVGTFQMDNIQIMAPYYTTVIIFIMCINIFFVLVSSLLLTRLIFRPLSKVENHMKLVEKGQFIEMGIDDEDNEINNLKKVFNHMTLSIKSLITQIKYEEQIIAKGKLDLIQAQINPHFLYNTLDAVSALALMEDNENCFKITQSLGNFYRNSLNSGKDFVTISEEIDCIKSYMTILDMRYENTIHMEYDVEEAIKDCKILKLLLQPLVENAVHHGLEGEEGTINIKIFSDEDEIILMVSDTGIGIEEGKIDEILTGKTVTGKSGFGIYSLIERIRIYYGISNPIMIHSEIGSGTEIAIRVKIMEGENIWE